jgi:Orotidine 5'-phosphate decarboxylase / HUMPS family
MIKIRSFQSLEAMTSYEQKLAEANNPITKRLLSIILEKESNLCVSIDVTSPDELLSIAREVGPYVCIIKVPCAHSPLTTPDSCRHPDILPGHTDPGITISIAGIQLPYL